VIFVEKIFLVHYEPLRDRKIVMEKQLELNGLRCEWVTSEPTGDDVASFYEENREQWYKKTKCLNYFHEEKSRKLRKAEISVAYKHLKVYKKILEEKIQSCLVLEDDSIFIENFVNEFNINFMKTPKDWDFIFIGNGCGLRIPSHLRESGKTCYPKEHPATKCLDSYIINHNSAEKILNTMIRLNLPIDFELNYQMFVNNMKVYWWDPPIVFQGSQNGTYKSGVQI